jgi:hypothetical protein
MEIRHDHQTRNDRPVESIESPGTCEPSFVEALVHPAEIFGDPREVVEHPWFTDEEKRTILLSWVRDELVIEQVAGRAVPELKPQSRVDAVLEALARFDPLAAGEYLSAVAAVRDVKRRRPFGRIGRN